MCSHSSFPRPQARLLRWVLFVLLELLWTSLLSPQPGFTQQPALSAEKRAAIEKAVASFMSGSSVPGVGAAVVLENFHTLSSWLYFQVVDRDGGPAARRTRKTRFGRARSKVLPSFSHEGMADHHAATAQPPGRHPALQPRWEGGHSRRQRPPFFNHGGITADFRE